MPPVIVTISPCTNINEAFKTMQGLKKFNVGGVGGKSYLIPNSTVFKSNMLPIFEPKDFSLQPVPPVVEIEMVGKDLYPEPWLYKNISVTSLLPVPISCINLFPWYESNCVVVSSNIIWSSVVLVLSSGVNAPLTTEIKPAAPPPLVLVLLKIKLSPMSYPDPDTSIKTSVILPEEIVLVWIIDDSPPPTMSLL